jgi:hypothetical protein
MCTGGGGTSKAKITDPLKKGKGGKYKDPLANVVEENVGFMVTKLGQMLDKNSTLNLTQEMVNASNQGLQQTLETLNQLSAAAADSQRLLQEDAMRLSALKGAPPPEKGADAPIVGRNRNPSVRSGRTRQDLRIDREQPATLSIT